MTDEKGYSKDDLKLAKAKLFVFESEMASLDKHELESQECIIKHKLLTRKVNEIKKLRIKESKRRYDNSEEGRIKNRARSLKNYYKKKATKT